MHWGGNATRQEPCPHPQVLCLDYFHYIILPLSLLENKGKVVGSVSSCKKGSTILHLYLGSGKHLGWIPRIVFERFLGITFKSDSPDWI